MAANLDYDLDNIYTYHPPTKDQQDEYVCLREKAKELAAMMLNYCEDCPELTRALYKLEESNMLANAAIARHSRHYKD